MATPFVQIHVNFVQIHVNKDAIRNRARRFCIKQLKISNELIAISYYLNFALDESHLFQR
jgi:hypothetical protein